MPGMGPAPKPEGHRARRNATVAMTMLPAEGRKGRSPAWPLGSDVDFEVDLAMAKLEQKELNDSLSWASTARERSAIRRKLDRAQEKITRLLAMRKAASAAEKRIWTALWKTPQATQWERRGWYREVAMFARHQAKAEAGSLDDAKEARQREDRLGLNDLAMLRLRWAIAEPAESPTKAPARKSGPPQPTGSRARRGNLTLVDPAKS